VSIPDATCRLYVQKTADTAPPSSFILATKICFDVTFRLHPVEEKEDEEQEIEDDDEDSA